MNKKVFSLKKFILLTVQIIILIVSLVSMILLISNFSYEYIWALLIIYYVLNMIFLFIIYVQKRNKIAKFSWIYFIILFPIIGNVVFVAFGLVFINKYELKLDNDPKYNIQTYIDQGLIPNLTSNDSQLQQYESLNNNKALPCLIKFYDQGYHLYDEVFKHIKNAKKSIFIVTYIIKKSEISKEFIHLIKQKKEEGIDIKWLVDDFGATFSQKRELNKLKKLGVEVYRIGKIYYPFINATSFTRNHQKYIIIDSKLVFSGGNNISDEYASLSKKYGHWIDLNYMITGPYVNYYNLAFIKFWKVITKKNIDIEPNLYFNYNYDLSLMDNQAILSIDSPSYNYSTAEYNWIQMLMNAKKEIIICSPYFSLSSALSKAMILALKKGIKVKLYFPGLPDKKFVYKISLYQIKQLMQFGLEVYIYNENFMHSKCGIIDDEIAWAGTSNWDSRSMFSQYETIDIFKGQAVSDLKTIINSYNKHCYLLKNSPLYTKNGTWVSRMIYHLSLPLI
ncbi:cardiolipin synthetase [Mycoplasma sp. NEAQ87857]|uniref:phospholipase D-like domain-containing protein n=1 Tax=Mycoplasma sp. NEAQ87857 TaxID=2683967 RepID=UPI001315CBB6|nr:phospholipase D-like domain-containing protein [Mycoplasma sp. NEAQ87857]QGZ97501.1 cardiolipin synthetase [Mycoplasma sp. NEAQ87857]